jgi:hypothetical protein
MFARLVCWITAHAWGDRIETRWGGWRQCTRCGRRQEVSARWVGTLTALGCPDEVELR